MDMLSIARARTAATIEGRARREKSCRVAGFGDGEHVHSARHANRVRRALSGLAVKPQIRHVHSEADEAQKEYPHADHHEHNHLSAVFTDAVAEPVCGCGCLMLALVFHTLTLLHCKAGERE